VKRSKTKKMGDQAVLPGDLGDGVNPFDFEKREKTTTGGRKKGIWAGDNGRLKIGQRL